MTEQTSRLAIVIDSSGAEKQADNLATALVKMTRIYHPFRFELRQILLLFVQLIQGSIHRVNTIEKFNWAVCCPDSFCNAHDPRSDDGYRSRTFYRPIPFSFIVSKTKNSNSCGSNRKRVNQPHNIGTNSLNSWLLPRQLLQCA
jgi:hypothetical protein